MARTSAQPDRTVSAGGLWVVPAAGGVAVAARDAAPGRGAPPPRLDLKGNNRTQLAERRVVFKAHRCKVRTCRTCGPQYGYRVRGGLLPKAAQFTMPALLTLTCDRKNFESPEDAYSFITDDGLIRRLMRFLGVTRWVWVLEFQQKTGEGWPHWHILIDLTSVPAQKLDLKRAWHLWRDKWQCGGVDLQLRKRFSSATHAIRYVTKYLTKYPEKGYPAWVLSYARRMRFFQASKAIGAILSEPKPAAASEASEEPSPESAELVADEPTQPKKRSPMRSLAARMAECGELCTAVVERAHGDGEPPEREYLGTLPIRPGRLVWLARFEQIRTPVQLQRQSVASEAGDASWLEPYLSDTGRERAEDLLQRLEDELRNQGETSRTFEAIEARERKLIDQNHYTEPAADPAEPLPEAEGDDVPF